MNKETIRQKRGLKEYAYLFFTGVCMGAADIVPGVSGGTMAFIMGIYEELLDAIKSINIRLLQLALKFKIKECFAHVPWKFGLVLGSGILITLKLLAGVIHNVMGDATGKMYLYAFFFGLVVTSIFTLSRHVKWNLAAAASLVAGTVCAWLVVGLVPSEMPHTAPFIFFSGMIAIMAMILPGISGSFILLILGQYAFVIESLKNIDLKVFVIFGAGAAIGLLGFARILSWLLNRFHALTIAALIGFMTGSLRKLWPFKDAEKTTYVQDHHGELIPIMEPNRLPDFSANEWWVSLALALVGMIVILAIEFIHRRMVGAQDEV
jgi:putative membrane protein